MKTRFVVLQAKGSAWDSTKLRRAQPGWDEHAAFMDKLTAEGFVMLGGPLGEADGDDALLIINAPDEATVRRTLGDDPWYASRTLQLKSVQRWNIFLDGSEAN